MVGLAGRNSVKQTRHELAKPGTEKTLQEHWKIERRYFVGLAVLARPGAANVRRRSRHDVFGMGFSRSLRPELSHCAGFPRIRGEGIFEP